MIRCLIQDVDGLAIMDTDYITIDMDGDKKHPFVYINNSDLSVKSYNLELVKNYNKYIYKAFNDGQINLSKYLFVYVENVHENRYDYYYEHKNNIKTFSFNNLTDDVTENNILKNPEEALEININDDTKDIISSLYNIKNLTEKRYNDILNK